MMKRSSSMTSDSITPSYLSGRTPALQSLIQTRFVQELSPAAISKEAHDLIANPKGHGGPGGERSRQGVASALSSVASPLPPVPHPRVLFEFDRRIQFKY
jgi:hypothetical protein